VPVRQGANGFRKHNGIFDRHITRYVKLSQRSHAGCIGAQAYEVIFARALSGHLLRLSAIDALIPETQGTRKAKFAKQSVETQARRDAKALECHDNHRFTIRSGKRLSMLKK
jgi:hypothetical protein